MRIWRIAFPLIAAIYVGHLFFFDRPMDLQPAHLWTSFRYSVAALAGASFLFYSSPALFGSAYYRVPAATLCWLLCFAQAQTANWYDTSQYLYAFVFVIASTMLLRSGPAASLAFAMATMATQWPALKATGISQSVLLSAVVATTTIVIVTRSRYFDDVRYFLVTQQNVESHRRNIELSIEFTDRIRAFLPQQISARLSRLLAGSHRGVLEAIHEVLRPEERSVSCLFSDIRGFTRKSKSSLTFLSDGVVPNVKRATAIIEDNWGVPRKIGDLVFAYFDDENPYVNLVRCLHAGLSLVDANRRMNDRNAPALSIKRYVLIASGTAVVGNIGGFDSSVEITALGPPVNLLSRLDELTKHPAFQARASDMDLIICPRSAELIRGLQLGVELQEVRVDALGLKVRDFEEVTSVWLVSATEHNYNALAQASAYLSSLNDSIFANVDRGDILTS